MTASGARKSAATKRRWPNWRRPGRTPWQRPSKYVVENQFGEIVEENGGAGMNAFTNNEETAYHYSFPSNRVELWAYLESDRFLHPVLREFYKERDVVHEERRLGESQPFGRLFEQFLGAAFIAHPYRQAGRGLALGSGIFFRDRRRDLLPQVLRPGEHGGDPGGRREGGRSPARHREVLRPPARAAQAGAAAHRGTAAELPSGS